MFDKLKSAIGGFVRSVTQKVEKKAKKKPKKVKKPIKREKKGVKPKKPGIGAILRGKIDAGLKVVTEEKIQEDAVNDPLDQLTISLIEANVALDVAEDLGVELKKKLVGKTIKRGKTKKVIEEEIKKVLLGKLNKTLDIGDYLKDKPLIIAITGINGSGKTTTVAKIVYWLQKKKKKIVVAAADTYRAAAIEQLEKHTDKLKVKMIKHEYGADAAS
jgi:fused signal recognition particle receptor